MLNSWSTYQDWLSSQQLPIIYMRFEIRNIFNIHIIILVISLTSPCLSQVKCSVMWSCSLPSLRPPGVRALLSPGQVFLLAVIDTSSSTLSARAPSMPLGRRSTRTRWLSVPPEIFSIFSKNIWRGRKSEASSLWSNHFDFSWTCVNVTSEL